MSRVRGSDQTTHAGAGPGLAPTEPVSARARWARLTERQREIATRIALGERRDEISAALRLSAKTFDAHRGRILERLEARGTADITRLAIAAGVVSVEVER
jgi:DNA-binding CsgD family transcriptional regulator